MSLSSWRSTPGSPHEGGPAGCRERDGHPDRYGPGHGCGSPNVGGPIPDDVDLPTLQSPETVVIDGSEYAVLISGFKQDGQIVIKFISAENGANSADIVAQLVLVGNPMSSPSTC